MMAAITFSYPSGLIAVSHKTAVSITCYQDMEKSLLPQHSSQQKAFIRKLSLLIKSSDLDSSISPHPRKSRRNNPAEPPPETVNTIRSDRRTAPGVLPSIHL